MKTVLITGASRGIGFELTKLFLQNGFYVICLSRNIEPLKKLNDQNLHTVSVDFTDNSQIQNAIDIIKSKTITVDYLINNAGILINKPIEEMSLFDIQQTYQVNVFTPYFLIQQLLPVMGLQQKSHIVNISSIGGMQGSVKFAGLSTYSSSKAALIGITECLAEELKNKNIAINALALGAVQTEMLSEAFPNYKANVLPNHMAQYIFDFTINGLHLFNGKVIPVANSTP